MELVKTATGCFESRNARDTSHNMAHASCDLSSTVKAGDIRLLAPAISFTGRTISGFI
jgi:hypothetical protein